MTRRVDSRDECNVNTISCSIARDALSQTARITVRERRGNLSTDLNVWVCSQVSRSEKASDNGVQWFLSRVAKSLQWRVSFSHCCAYAPVCLMPVVLQTVRSGWESPGGGWEPALLDETTHKNTQGVVQMCHEAPVAVWATSRELVKAVLRPAAPSSVRARYAPPEEEWHYLQDAV